MNPEGQSEQEPLATVTPIRPGLEPDLWPIERIDGIKMNLGRMSLDELVQLESHCRTREDAARMDAAIVRDHIDYRFVDGGGGDAA